VLIFSPALFMALVTQLEHMGDFAFIFPLLTAILPIIGLFLLPARTAVHQTSAVYRAVHPGRLVRLYSRLGCATGNRRRLLNHLPRLHTPSPLPRM